MGLKQKIFAWFSPDRSKPPEIPELPEGSSSDEREKSRKQHKEFLEEVAKLPEHEKGIAYVLFRLAGHINEPLGAYRTAAVEALKAVGLKIVAIGKPGRNGAMEILAKRLKKEENTYIKGKIQQAIMEIDAARRGANRRTE